MWQLKVILFVYQIKMWMYGTPKKYSLPSEIYPFNPARARYSG